MFEKTVLTTIFVPSDREVEDICIKTFVIFYTSSNSVSGISDSRGGKHEMIAS
jgi:hypothetical protein